MSTPRFHQFYHDAGIFLIQKYAQKQGLFGDFPDPFKSLDTISCSKVLLTKLKTGQSVTVRRAVIKATQGSAVIPEREVQEKKRLKIVSKKKKEVECLSSEMNLCQALVKPDCSKPKVAKASTIQRAISSHVSKIAGLESDGLIKLNSKQVPPEIVSNVKSVTIEFAGVKFKSRAGSGEEYLENVQNGVLRKTLNTFKSASKVVVCEEKYRFTPDDFKAATRSQRITKKRLNVTVNLLVHGVRPGGDPTTPGDNLVHIFTVSIQILLLTTSLCIPCVAIFLKFFVSIFCCWHF